MSFCGVWPRLCADCGGRGARRLRRAFSIGHVGDYIFTYRLKPQRLRCEVGTAVTHVRKWHERLDRFVDFFTNPVGSVEVVCGDVFPDLVEIRVGLRVSNESAHESARRFSPLALAPEVC